MICGYRFITSSLIFRDHLKIIVIFVPFKPLFGNVYISIAKYVLLMSKRFVIRKNISHEKSWSGEGLLFMFHTIRITTFNSNCCYPQSET